MSGGTGGALAEMLFDGRRLVALVDVAAPPSLHFHHDNECTLSPVSAAYSAAVSPLSFQRSTRFAQSSRDAFAMPTSGMQPYATARPPSGT